MCTKQDQLQKWEMLFFCGYKMCNYIKVVGLWIMCQSLLTFSKKLHNCFLFVNYIKNMLFLIIMPLGIRIDNVGNC